MVTIKNVEGKMTPSRRNITVKNALVSALKFMDESGDVTKTVLDAIPADVKTITVKISIEIDDVDD